MKRPSPLFVLVPLLLSCGGTASSSSLEPASSSSASSTPTPSYVEKEINVFYAKKELNQKTKLRFYGGSDIPYIGIDEFYALLLKGQSKDPNRSKLDTKVEGSVYTITSPGGKATFDTDENTMVSPCLPFFTGTKTYESGLKSMMGTDGMPWIKIKEVKVDKEAQATEVDFDDYSIDLYGDATRLYLPLPTLQDLFSDTCLLTSFYNRQDLYIYTGAFTETDVFGKGIYDPCLAKDIGVGYATYLYNEMCFDYDVILGRPTRSSLERYYDLSLGLDKALVKRPYGKLLKDSMTDGTALGYATGLLMLGYLVADGGHSKVSPFNSINFDPEAGRSYFPQWAITLSPEVEKRMEELLKSDYEELTNTCKSYGHHKEIRTNRRDILHLPQESLSSLRGEQTYFKASNDTAFIFIDDYMGDCLNDEAWKNYYEGTSELPYGENVGGAVAALYKGLEKVQKDRSIKNIVVDLSSNTGGSVDEMVYLISLLTANKAGETTFSVENNITKQKLTATFDIDRNLDRVFDEKDASFNPVEGKNVAVLMSQNGYSCGGISPIYLHDRGIFTMGDDSGGGSCSILYQHTGVGLFTVRSSSDATLDKNGKKIDEVRLGSCDHKFDIKEGAKKGTLDFSAFFDIKDIENVLNDHFAPKA